VYALFFLSAPNQFNSVFTHDVYAIPCTNWFIIQIIVIAKDDLREGTIKFISDVIPKLKSSIFFKSNLSANAPLKPFDTP
jgi:hypothetical protein